MFCTKCGKRIDYNSTVCNECARAENSFFDASQQYNTDSQPQKAEPMPVEESLPTPPVQEEIAALESEPIFDAAPTEAEIQEEIQEVVREDTREDRLEEAAAEAEELRTSESQAEEEDDVAPQRTSAAHPLERIVPLSPVTDEEEDEPLPPPPAKEPVSRTPQPTEPVVTAPEQKPTPQMITIAKPQVDPHPKKPTQASAAQPSRPVVIKPKSEPLPSASPRQADPDTIVIRPRANTAQAKSPIVIQPPTAKRSAPTPRLQQAEAASAPPIKIGKESRTQVAPPP